MRPDEPADRGVYNEVIGERANDLSSGNPLAIIDAGAHFGITSTFFASQYPNAIIVAIEPQEETRGGAAATFRSALAHVLISLISTYENNDACN